MYRGLSVCLSRPWALQKPMSGSSKLTGAVPSFCCRLEENYRLVLRALKWMSACRMTSVPSSESEQGPCLTTMSRTSPEICQQPVSLLTKNTNRLNQGNDGDTRSVPLPLGGDWKAGACVECTSVPSSASTVRDWPRVDTVSTVSSRMSTAARRPSAYRRSHRGSASCFICTLDNAKLSFYRSSYTVIICQHHTYCYRYSITHSLFHSRLKTFPFCVFSFFLFLHFLVVGFVR